MISAKLFAIAEIDPSSPIGIAVKLLAEDIAKDEKRKASQRERTRQYEARKLLASRQANVSLTTHHDTGKCEPNVSLTLDHEVHNTSIVLDKLDKVSKNMHSSQKRTRGTRLPENWEPSFEDLQYARTAGYSEEQISVYIAPKFRDHWLATTKNAVKNNWSAAWRTWVRNALKWQDPIPLRHSNTVNVISIAKPLTQFQKDRAVFNERMNAIKEMELSLERNDASQSSLALGPPDGQTVPGNGRGTYP